MNVLDLNEPSNGKCNIQICEFYCIKYFGKIFNRSTLHVCCDVTEQGSHNQDEWYIVNHETKKKQHVCSSLGLRDHYSELFTWESALNF